MKTVTFTAATLLATATCGLATPTAVTPYDQVEKGWTESKGAYSSMFLDGTLLTNDQVKRVVENRSGRMHQDSWAAAVKDALNIDNGVKESVDRMVTVAATVCKENGGVDCFKKGFVSAIADKVGAPSVETDWFKGTITEELTEKATPVVLQLVKFMGTNGMLPLLESVQKMDVAAMRKHGLGHLLTQMHELAKSPIAPILLKHVKEEIFGSSSTQGWKKIWHAAKVLFKATKDHNDPQVGIFGKMLTARVEQHAGTTGGAPGAAVKGNDQVTLTIDGATNEVQDMVAVPKSDYGATSYAEAWNALEKKITEDNFGRALGQQDVPHDNRGYFLELVDLVERVVSQNLSIFEDIFDREFALKVQEVAQLFAKNAKSMLYAQTENSTPQYTIYVLSNSKLHQMRTSFLEATFSSLFRFDETSTFALLRLLKLKESAAVLRLIVKELLFSENQMDYLVDAMHHVTYKMTQFMLAERANDANIRNMHKEMDSVLKNAWEGAFRAAIVPLNAQGVPSVRTRIPHTVGDDMGLETGIVAIAEQRARAAADRTAEWAREAEEERRSRITPEALDLRGAPSGRQVDVRGKSIKLPGGLWYQEADGSEITLTAGEGKLLDRPEAERQFVDAHKGHLLKTLMRMYALQAESFFGVFTTEDGAKAVKKLKELVFDQLNRNKLFEGGFLAAIKKNLTRMFNAVRNHSIRNNLVIFRINGEPTTLLVRELRKVRFFVPLEGEIVVITEEPAKDEPVAPIADPAPPASDEGLAGWQIALIVVLPTLAVVAAAIGIY
ncbi:unnamed protein product, partial [Amoebophrya sp. A25]|eukprot:GSA25T00001579001.1